jgi:hemin uptake protein HemP
MTTLAAASLPQAAAHAAGRALASLGLSPTPKATEPAVESTELLQGRKAVAIHHNGSVYRLQATKLGKLILTK